MSLKELQKKHAKVSSRIGKRTKTGLEAREEGLIDRFVTDEEKFRENVLNKHFNNIVRKSREYGGLSTANGTTREKIS